MAPTEKLQKWHQPRPSKTLPKTCTEAFGKPSTSTVKVGQNFNWACLSNNLPLLRVLKNAETVRYEMSIPLPAVAFGGENRGLSDLILPYDEIVFYHSFVALSVEDLLQLELSTRDQGKAWKDARRYRLTASNFHRVLTRKANFQELAKSIANPPDLSNVPAVKYGNKYEGWVRNVIRDRFREYVLRDTGLVSHPQYPFLGGSPDGFLYSREKEPMILEIKCIFNLQGDSLGSLVEKRKDFCLYENGGEFSLKRSHKFYTQIQGQMAMSGIQKCLFVVFHSKDTNKLFSEIIDFDEGYWQKLFPILMNFYFGFYLKLLC